MGIRMTIWGNLHNNLDFPYRQLHKSNILIVLEMEIIAENTNFLEHNHPTFLNLQTGSMACTKYRYHSSRQIF